MEVFIVHSLEFFLYYYLKMKPIKLTVNVTNNVFLFQILTGQNVRSKVEQVESVRLKLFVLRLSH